MSDIIRFLQSRRSVVVRKQGQRPLSDGHLEDILACGMRVPDHGGLAPWRIVVIDSASGSRLGREILAPQFLAAHPDATQVMLEAEQLDARELEVARRGERDAAEEEEAEAPAGGTGDLLGEGSSLYDQAVQLVVREQKASTSFVQRHLKIGYNRAATIIEEMESNGIISAANHVGKREVLVTEGDGQ